MSEMNPTASTNDSNEAAVKEPEEHLGEPDTKKPKIAASVEEKETTLEHRLGGILCCTVCLDLPKAAIYQCTNGHLMCVGCFSHLLADARLRDETATCPGCRIEISKTAASRNLAVEKAVSELPSECQFCGKEYPRNSLERHEQALCDERITKCQYSRIGCPWRGPYHEQLEHERICIHPHNTGAQILEVLDVMEREKEAEKKLYDSIIELLSCEKMTFSDLQLKPYRTDEFIHKLYYETTRFNLYNHQWVVKARINSTNQKDPTLSCDRDMVYQLILKSKTAVPLTMHYMVLRGPYSDIKVGAKIYKWEFTEEANEAPFTMLPLKDNAECNRLLAAKAINFRLIICLLPK